MIQSDTDRAERCAERNAERRAYRASILHFTDDPARSSDAFEWYEDGVLLVEQDRVIAVGDYASFAAGSYGGAEVVDWRGRVIVPGFIDTHIHYSQADIIGSPSSGLLGWLDSHTFPAERAFSDPAHAADVARFFLDQLLRCGTTTAMVYCTVHPESVQAFFSESEARNLRMVAGKLLMDRNCPVYLRDTAHGGLEDSEQLLKTWHGRGRQMYALTPRFAATSSEVQLQLAGELAQAYPDLFIQTHVAENRDEVAWIRQLFPDARSYLDVYDRYGLLRERSMYAHCLWLDDADRLRMVASGAAAAVCPTSNLFLGSGLFNFESADAAGMQITLATDVGAGTSFSLLQTMNAAYKVGRMGGSHMSGLRMFYLVTLGAARAMRLEGTIGNFQPGCEADFLVLDPRATPVLERRTARAADLEELLFAFALLGDDRAVAATYAAGRLVHERAD